MSRSIDERIVEMKFNNKDFERNASETMSTLEKLKAKLKFDGATKGIEEIERAGKKFSLSNMDSATDVTVKKFDSMAIAAATAINRIVDTAMSAGEKLVKSLSVDQIMAGWDKYSKKTTSIGTMISQGYSQAEVDKELSRLLWFTDETSYDFSTMVDSISKFTASGKDLHSSVDALEGIALWAAKSGQNASTASVAMYQLAQAIARPMNKQDWISVMNANMDTVEFRQTAIDAAVEVGTLKKTAEGVYQTIAGEMVTTENFIDSLSNGKWLTGDVQMATYKKYAAAVEDIYNYTQQNDVLAATAIKNLKGEVDEFSRSAFKAGQETRTLEDAISATKDAVSSGWMTTFEYIFGDYTQATSFWSDFVEKLYDAFAEPINERNEILSEALPSGFSRFIEETKIDPDILIEGLKQLIPDVNSATKESLSSTFEALGASENEVIKNLLNSYSGIDLDALIEKYGSFEDSLQAGWLTSDMLATAIHNAVTYFEDLKKENPDVAFSDSVLKYIEAYKELDVQIQNGSYDLESLVKVMSKPSGRFNLVSAFNNVWQSASNIIGIFKEAISDVFPPITVETIYNITAKIRDFTERLSLSSDQAEGLKNIIRGILTPVKGLLDVLKWLGRKAGTIFGGIVRSVVSIFERFKDIHTFQDVVRSIFGDKRFTRLSAAWDVLSTRLTTAFDKIRSAFGLFKKDVEKTGGPFLKIWETIKEVLAPLGDWILDRIVDAFAYLATIDWSMIADNIISAFNDVVVFIKNIPAIIKEIPDAISNLVDRIKNGDIIKALEDFWSDFAEKSPSLYNIFNSLLEPIWAFISNLSPAKIALVVALIGAFKLLFGFVGVVRSISWIGDAIWGVINAFKRKIQGSILLTIASVVAAIAGSIAILASLPAEQVKTAGIVLAGMIGVFVILAVLSKKIGSIKTTIRSDLSSLAFIGSLVGAIFTLSGSLTLLGSVPTNQMINSAIVLGIISIAFVGLIAISKLISKIKSTIRSDLTTMGLIGSLAGALFTLSGSLTLLGSVPTNQMINSAAVLGILSIIFVGIIAISKLISKIKSTVRSDLTTMGLIGSLAGALFTLSGSLTLLGSVPTNQLISSAIVLGILSVVFIGLVTIAKLISKIKSTIRSDLTTMGLIGSLGGALFTAAKALQMLSGINVNDIGIKILALLGVLVSIIAAAKLASLLLKGGVKGSITLLIVASAIVILTHAMGVLATIPYETLRDSISKLSIIAGVITALSIILRLTGSKRFTSSLGILVMIFSLLAVTSALKKLAQEPIDVLLTGLLKFIPIALALLVLSGILRLIGSRAKINNNPAIMLLILAGSIFVLTQVIKDIGRTPTNELVKGGIAITIMLGVLVLLMSLSLFMADEAKKGGKGLLKSAASMVALSAAVAILMLALSAISSFPIANIATAIAAISLLMVGIGYMFKQASKYEGSFKVLLTVMAILVTISAVIVFLGSISWQQALQATAGLSLTMLAIAVSLGVLSKIEISSFKDLLKTVAAFAILISGIIAIVGLISLLVASIPGSQEAIMQGISIFASFGQLWPFLLEMTILFAALSFISTIIDGAKDALNVAVVELLFGLLIAIMTGVTTLAGLMDSAGKLSSGIEALKQFAGLTPVLLEFAGLFAVLAFIGLVGSNPIIWASIGIMELLFGTLVLIISGVAYVVGLMADTNFYKGLEALSAIGTAIGEFVGGLIGGIAKGVIEAITSVLPFVALKLYEFLTLIAPSVVLLNSLHIQQSTTEALKNLGEAMLIFTAAGFVESIPILGDLAFGKAAEQLSAMIDAMITVDQKLSEYNKNTTDHAVFDQDLTERLRGFASMFKEIQAVVPRTGGWAQQILGEQDMATFGQRIVKFIMAAKLADITLRRYIDSVGDAAWNKDTTERVINVGTMFASLEKAIPPQNGVLQGFLGSSSLDTFGERIVTFIDAMVSFDTAIRLYEEEHGGFKKSRAAAVVTIGTMLSNLEKALPEQKGAFLAFFSTNKQSLADFASGLGPLGEGIASFAVALNNSEGGDILGDAQKMKDAAEALKVIVDAWSGIAGETDGTTVDKIANGELSVFDKWGIALSLVQDLLTPAENGETKINAVKHMAEGLVQFAQAIAPFFDATAGMDFTRLTAFGQAFADIAMAFNIAGSMDENAANTLKAGAIDIAQMQVNSFIEELYAQKKKVNDVSKEVFVDTLAKMINAPDSIEKQHSIGYTMAENVQAGAKMRFDKPTALTQEDVENMFAGGAGPEQSYQMARKYGENLADAASSGYSENVELAVPASGIPGMDLTSMFQYIPGMGGSGGFEIGNIIGNDVFDGLKGILSGSVGDTGGITSLLSGVFNPSSNANLLEGLTGDGGDIADALTGGTLSFLGDSANYEDIYSVLGDSFGSFGTGTDFTELGNLMNADGSEAMLAYFGGMPEAIDSEEAQKSLSGTFDELTRAMKGNIDETMPATGKYAVDGFIKGINHPDSLKKLRTAGTSMATTFAKAVDTGLDISSPSKVMEQSGQYTVVGFVKGVLESMYMAKDAADKLGISTVDAMSAAVSYAYAAAISDYDFTPTISPVLDLSEVRAGASGLSGLFDLSPQIKMASDNNRMVNEYVSRVQADNAAAFAALNNLQDNMAKVGGRLEDGWQPDLEGAIERGFSNVSVNLDGKKVGKMNVDYQNRQNFLRGKTQVK